MSKLITMDSEYAGWIRELSTRFRQCQIKAAAKVNSEMMRFYWDLGRDVVELKAEEKWSGNFWSNLSNDLRATLPGINGFSITNLQYSRRFYNLYSPLVLRHPQIGERPGLESKISLHPQLGGVQAAHLFCVPWGHHKLIIDKCRENPDKAVFFVYQTIKHNWSRSMLLNFLKTDLYERHGKAVSNFLATMPEPEGELAQQLMKDPYNFDFLQLTEQYTERELKDALLKNITDFLLELGTGFAFMGREYRIQVSTKEQFIDLLFYNVNLRCFVVIEVKTEEFETSHLGQLSGYVSFVNRLLKKPDDNPTVGLLICRDKDNVFAQYALEGYNNPLGISEYELSKVFPKDFKGTLPSIEDIEREMLNANLSTLTPHS